MSIEIIGSKEYQEFMAMNKDGGFTLYGTELHLFHKKFIDMLDNEVEPIFLDYIEDFSSDIPKRQGIYFCARVIPFFAKEVWYVGKTVNFKSRWKNHHKLQALKAIKDVLLYCLPLDNYSGKEIIEAENAYINMLTPVFNNTSNPEKYLSVAS